MYCTHSSKVVPLHVWVCVCLCISDIQYKYTQDFLFIENWTCPPYHHQRSYILTYMYVHTWWGLWTRKRANIICCKCCYHTYIYVWYHPSLPPSSLRYLHFTSLLLFPMSVVCGKYFAIVNTSMTATTCGHIVTCFFMYVCVHILWFVFFMKYIRNKFKIRCIYARNMN